MTLDEKIPLQPGNWTHLNQFLAVGHNADGTTVGGSSSETLSQVLVNGNDAGGHNITGVGDITLTGLTGATQATRYVGATTSGAPLAGTFAKGDFIIAQDGYIWICTTAGSPGSWVSAGGIVAKGRARFGGVTQYSMPGCMLQGANIVTSAPNRSTYFPYLVDTQIVIDQIVVELTTGVAASTIRLCLYRADTDWQPTTLVAGTDTGNIAAAVANQGIIATTIADTTLQSGRYLAWMSTSAGNHQFRSLRTSVTQWLGVPVAVGANASFTQIYAASTYGAPASTGVVWTNADVSAAWFEHPVMIRIKTA